MAEENNPNENDANRHVEVTTASKSDRWSMSALKTQWLDAGGAIASAIVISVTRAGKFGKAPFSYQLCLFFLGLFVAPSLHRRFFPSSSVTAPSPASSSISSTSTTEATTDSSSSTPATTSQTTRVPLIIRLGFQICATLWTLFCALPVFYAFIIELFTGHRRPGAQWYDGVWRVYAIVVLWLAFSVFHLRVIRPWWRLQSEWLLAGARHGSLASAVNRAAAVRRDEKLKVLRERGEILVRRRARINARIARSEAAKVKLEAAISTSLSSSSLTTGTERDKNNDYSKEEDLAVGNDNIEENDMEQVPALAKGRYQEVDEETREELLHTIDRIQELKEELEEAEDDIKSLRSEWTEALHINNHRGFYR